MSGKRIGVVLLATAAAWSLQGVAQTNKTEARATLEREQATLSQQIADRQQQIKTLRARPGPEQAELTAAQKALDAARAAHQAASTEESEARLKNAEFKYMLAERKLNKANTELNALSEEVEQLQRQLAAGQQQLKTFDQKDAEPVAPAPQQRVIDERVRRQEQELQRSRREAENQQKEIERLKALLAAKEAAAQKTAAAETAKPEPAPPAPLTPASQSAAKGLYKIANRQEMLQELQSLEKRLDGLSTRSRGGINEALYLKPKSRKVTNKDRITLHALGLEQYRGEARVEPGDYELILGLNHWPLRIDDSESGAFVFLYDNSDAGKPQLVLYNRLLENETPR